MSSGPTYTKYTPWGILQRPGVSYYFSGDKPEKFLKEGFKFEPHPQGDYLVVVWPNGRKMPVLGSLAVDFRGLHMHIKEVVEQIDRKDLPSGAKEIESGEPELSDEEFMELANKHRAEIIKQFGVPSMTLQKGGKKK